jgi:hypothetical protein
LAEKSLITGALSNFAEKVKAKSNQLIGGKPEDQLRAPIEEFFDKVGSLLGWEIECTGETLLPDRIGCPDYAIFLNQLLAGYLELKAPGKGANVKHYKGHDKEQWKRFSAIPNLLYSDGNEWALYRNGEMIRMVRLDGDIVTDGKRAVSDDNAASLHDLLQDFLLWEPFIPTDSKGKINLKDFASILAPLCRMLRDEVKDALQDSGSPLTHLASEWRHLLFPDASDDQFADAYAQTVTFALLLGRSEGADPLSYESAEAKLDAEHTLLARALKELTDTDARKEISASLNLLLRVIGAAPPSTFTGPKDPWLYFYEDFLAAYDPELRKNAGAYYTPVEVVHAQVRLLDDILVNRLQKSLGFLDSDVISLDPALGTGTYLLGIIEHALKKIEEQQGEGAVAGQASTLARNLYGFEIMVGPYAVSELRVSRALRDRGATLPPKGTQIFLADTLEKPEIARDQIIMGMTQRVFADQHKRAVEVKADVPVIVCLGNPPYDRHEAATESNKAKTGGWIRWGEDGQGTGAILRNFIDPATAAGHGVHIKNLYNLYVYFWRWALWKVFENKNSPGPGIVSFISASSYLDGDAFCGMREHMRRLCDEIWILDLGGEGRGTRRSKNVFDIQTPVAIAITLRTGETDKNTPATVHFARLEGTRAEKLEFLDSFSKIESITWQECPREWQAPFRPAGTGEYFNWPLLTDLMPWQHSGVKTGRTWVIAPSKNVLEKRWKTLLIREKGHRQELFKDSPSGRKTCQKAFQLPPSREELQPISELPENSPFPEIVSFAYRSFDNQFLFRDARLIDRPGPDLWRIHSEKQLYFSSLFSQPLSQGPALTTCSSIPDLHHFRGSYGAKSVIPLYRTNNPLEPNMLPELLNILEKIFSKRILPEKFAAYVYGALAQPYFTHLFQKELETREIRVPITKDYAFFDQMSALGSHLIWLHTYGERFVPEGQRKGVIPIGSAKCVKAVPEDPEEYPESFEYSATNETLFVGKGAFRPVSQEVYDFEVSGLKVVQSWLKYRMKQGAGRKSSPLDDIRPERWTAESTSELLKLLWILEATLNIYPKQAELLQQIINGPCFTENELPPVPDEMRHPPSNRPKSGRLPF